MSERRIAIFDFIAVVYNTGCGQSLVNAVTGEVPVPKLSVTPYQELAFGCADYCRKRVVDTLYQTTNPTIRPMTTVK